MAPRISYIVGDITEQGVDAIVNAAKGSLLGGGGVDGAIHRAAGPQLQEECATLWGCDYGEAKITAGYNLPARYVIHTVGPIYGIMEGKEAEILAACYTNSLRIAKEYSLSSIAFPAISTGAYGYPKAEAAEIALRTVRGFLEKEESNMEVRFVLYSTEDSTYYIDL